MSIEFLRNHARVLSEFAAATTARAALNPEDFWLQIAAKNQQQAAEDAIQALAAARARETGEIDKQEPFKRQLVDTERLD
jgi:ribonuclease D